MILYAAETIIYLAFMGMDICGIGQTTPLKYPAILLLCLSTLDFREKKVTLALCFTALADLFLLVLDRYYAAGIVCFLVVQLLYAARLQEGRSAEKPSVFSFALSFLLPASAGLIVCSSSGSGLTEGLAAAYITLFAVNLVQACLLAGRTGQRRWVLFAWGLALFFCCDLCVGLHNMPGMGGPALQRFADVAMWGFYLPGQVLIRASAYPRDPDESPKEKTL